MTDTTEADLMAVFRHVADTPTLIEARSSLFAQVLSMLEQCRQENATLKAKVDLLIRRAKDR